MSERRHIQPHQGYSLSYLNAVLVWVSKYKVKMDEVRAFARIQGGGGVFNVESLEELDTEWWSASRAFR